MNEVLNTIASRYSCRAFTNERPTDGQIEALALAAVQSPSAVNRQPWRIIVVENKALIDEMDAEAIKVLSESDDVPSYQRIIARGGRMFYNAPCMLVIAIEADAGERAVRDCGFVAQNIALAASSLGLGNVICAMARLAFGGEKAEEFRQRIGMQDGFIFGLSVLVGHPEKPGTPHEPDISKISYIK